MEYTLTKKQNKILNRFNEIEALLMNPTIHNDPKQLAKLGKERNDTSTVMHHIQIKQKHAQSLDEIQKQLKQENDSELIELLETEKVELLALLKKNEEQLNLAMLPKDKLSGSNIYLEIRAGTGGDEAALFGRDLFKMYLRYFDKHIWSYEIISMDETGLDGLKEVIIFIKNKQAYDFLLLEAGVHRVQRIPSTDSQGRIHTSACTIAIIPEVKDINVQIEPNELRIDVYRSSGPGGQSVNTTDSAVRITHIPTNLVVSCQDEKSQHKNKAKALKILEIRLGEKIRKERNEKLAAEKKIMIGTGDRSERIRTYNFPQNRITDHRTNLTLHSLDKCLEGDIEDIINSLKKYRFEQQIETA